MGWRWTEQPSFLSGPRAPLADVVVWLCPFGDLRLLSSKQTQALGIQVWDPSCLPGSWPDLFCIPPHP